MPITTSQQTRDSQIAQLMRQREDAERRRGDLKGAYEKHRSALARLNPLSGIFSRPKLRVVDGKLLSDVGGELSWPSWEDVRDTVAELQEVEQELAEISRQLAELGITVPPSKPR